MSYLREMTHCCMNDKRCEHIPNVEYIVSFAWNPENGFANGFCCSSNLMLYVNIWSSQQTKLLNLYSTIRAKNVFAWHMQLHTIFRVTVWWSFMCVWCIKRPEPTHAHNEYSHDCNTCARYSILSLSSSQPRQRIVLCVSMWVSRFASENVQSVIINYTLAIRCSGIFVITRWPICRLNYPSTVYHNIGREWTRLHGALHSSNVNVRCEAHIHNTQWNIRWKWFSVWSLERIEEQTAACRAIKNQRAHRQRCVMCNVMGVGAHGIVFYVNFLVTASFILSSCVFLMPQFTIKLCILIEMSSSLLKLHTKQNTNATIHVSTYSSKLAYVNANRIYVYEYPVRI